MGASLLANTKDPNSNLPDISRAWKNVFASKLAPTEGVPNAALIGNFPLTDIRTISGFPLISLRKPL